MLTYFSDHIAQRFPRHLTCTQN